MIITILTDDLGSVADTADVSVVTDTDTFVGRTLTPVQILAAVTSALAGQHPAYLTPVVERTGEGGEVEVDEVDGPDGAVEVEVDDVDPHIDHDAAGRSKSGSRKWVSGSHSESPYVL